MKLNDLELFSYNTSPETIIFDLFCDMQEALSLDGNDLVVTDNGVEISYFSGWTLTSIKKEPTFIKVVFSRNLDPDTKNAILALETNQSMHSNDIQTMQEEIALQSDVLEELISFTLGGLDG